MLICVQVKFWPYHDHVALVRTLRESRDDVRGGHRPCSPIVQPRQVAGHRRRRRWLSSGVTPTFDRRDARWRPHLMHVRWENPPNEIGKTAARELFLNGIMSLKQVARHSRKELLAIHGVGPKTVWVTFDSSPCRGRCLDSSTGDVARPRVGRPRVGRARSVAVGCGEERRGNGS